MRMSVMMMLMVVMVIIFAVASYVGGSGTVRFIHELDKVTFPQTGICE